MTLEKKLEEITEADLSAIVVQQQPEKRTIEYKRDLPGEKDDDKKEFLADASSFANASGGNIMFGIPEENGLPLALDGITCDDPDREILRIENLLRDGLEPRLQGVAVRAVPLQSGAFIFILRIPRSWSRPHVVNYKGRWRFYSRNSAGKYPLDVGEVRQVFLNSSVLTDRIRLFRDERLGSIYADETPASLVSGAKIVMHLIPYAAFDSSSSFSIEGVAKDPASVRPIYSSYGSRRYNLDGFLIAGDQTAGLSSGYVQIYRNGIIESVDARMLTRGNNPPTIPSVVFEEQLYYSLSEYLKIQKQMTVPPPISVAVSLLGVSGYYLAVNQRMDPFRENSHPIDRDTVTLPELILDTYPADADVVLKPIFDAVWNAAGWNRSYGYDDQGQWGKGPNFIR